MFYVQQQFVHIHFELFISKFSYWKCALWLLCVLLGLHILKTYTNIRKYILLSMSTFALWHLWQMSSFQLKLSVEWRNNLLHNDSHRTTMPSQNNKITSITFLPIYGKIWKITVNSPWIYSSFLNLFFPFVLNNRRTFAFSKSNLIWNRMHVYIVRVYCSHTRCYNLSTTYDYSILILFVWFIHAEWIALNSA